MVKKEIPSEVMWAGMIIYYNQPVGTTVYEKIKEIISKYPEHFPWETKYNNIPEDVHSAYKLEAHGKLIDYLKMPLFNETQSGEGVESQINKIQNPTCYKEATKQDFIDFMDLLTKKEEDERNEDIRIRKIWNKHYKKYNLEYRKNY